VTPVVKARKTDLISRINSERLDNFIRVCKFVFGKHSYQNMEMVSHQTKPQNLNQIQSRVVSDQIQRKILFNIAQWEAVQGGSGHHVINSALIINYFSLRSWHVWLLGG
jgi:hypothetical protein